MSRLGYALLTLGFLAATFAASLHPEQVNWALFVPAIVAGAIGVLMVRRARIVAAKDSGLLDSNKEALNEALADTTARLEAIAAQLDGGGDVDLQAEIDAQLREPLRTFADARESMIHLYGIQSYADIMSAFAAGERYVNRVWSASADGYADEARDALARATAQFAEARGKLDRARAGG